MAAQSESKLPATHRRSREVGGGSCRSMIRRWQWEEEARADAGRSRGRLVPPWDPFGPMTGRAAKNGGSTPGERRCPQ